MPSVVEEILAYNAGRDPERLQLKLKRLAKNPFVFLRGTCHLFYSRLPATPVLDEPPPAWSCGDLHLENFGSFKGDNGQVYFDIDDFDEAALAPCTWDPLRLLVSLRLAASRIELGLDLTLDLSRAFIASYAANLADGKAGWIERDTAEGMVRTLLDKLRKRKNRALLDQRTVLEHHRRTIRVDEGKALRASDEQRATVETVVESAVRDHADPGFYRVLDVARRISGTGGLGVDRYVILVEGNGTPHHNCLLDLKQSLPSALGPRLRVRQPQWQSQADRVVAIQHRVQAISPAFLRPVQMGGNSYVLRDLQPSKDRIALKRAKEKPARLEGLMRTLGAIVASSQLRSSGRDGSATADDLIAFARTKSWHLPLLQLAAETAARVQEEWREYHRAHKAGLVATS